MTDVLNSLYRHHRWATLTLFDFCAGLDHAVLDQTASGVYGTIANTWRHIARGERNYLHAIDGTPRDTDRFLEPPMPLPQVRAELDRSTGELIGWLGRVGERDTFEAQWGGERSTMPKMVPLLQAIEHGTEHRTNITTVLQANGIEAPQIDLWAYAQVLAREDQPE
jgi:uncharacterized damage-inducible protein DinB